MNILLTLLLFCCCADAALQTPKQAMLTPTLVVKHLPSIQKTNVVIQVTPPSLSTALLSASQVNGTYKYETNMVTDIITLRMAGQQRFYKAYRERQVVTMIITPTADSSVVQQRYYAEGPPGLFKAVIVAKNTGTNSFVNTNSAAFVRVTAVNVDKDGNESAFCDVVILTNKPQTISIKAQ